MALTERHEVDKIEIVGPHRTVQVRTATVIERDGEEITRSYHRHAVSAGDDYSNETAEVQAVCAAVHTTEVITAYQATQEAMQSEVGTMPTPETPTTMPAPERPKTRD